MAREMTRRWLRLQAAGGKSKADKISKINEELEKHKVRQKFRRLVELDGYYGRAHLYLDMGVNMDDRDGLKAPIVMDRRTFDIGQLKYLQVVEPTWSYPGMYNSNNPLVRDFYVPTTWYVFSREIHKTRLLSVIGRPMPDLLKPAYAFGGLSISQLAKPYVDNWLQTRSSVNQLIQSFSTMVLATNMSGSLGGGGGEAEATRAELYNLYRSNQGLMMIDKNTELLTNVQTSLGTLDHLQAQAQEHMASASGATMPLVVLTGITPSGLNASSEGELQVWGQTIHAMQVNMLDEPFKRVLDAIQLDTFGEIDPDITHEWEPLKEESDEEVQKRRMDESAAHKTYVEMGAVGPDEVRETLAVDPDSVYAGLDLSGPPPTPPMAEGDPLGAGPGGAGGSGGGGGLGGPSPSPGGQPGMAQLRYLSGSLSHDI
jgi:phage-related protein (TIGR01555 family)